MEEEESSVMSPIEIIVTDEDEDKHDDEGESVKTPVDDSSTHEQEGTADVDTIHLDVASRRESVALQIMDQEYMWLSEFEEKYANIETAFIWKVQFVALSNHFQRCLKELEDEERTSEIVAEFTNLFDKFRTCFAGGHRLYNKLQEMVATKALTDAENLNLKRKLSERENQVSTLQTLIENTTKDVEEEDIEKVKLYQQLIELKEEIEKGKKRLDKEESEEQIKAPITDDTEEEVKIQKLEEELESLKNDFAFSKKREAIVSNNLNEADKRIDSLQNVLTSTKFELQKQITQREKAEKFSTATSENLEKKKGVIQELKSEIQELEKKLEISQSKANSFLKEARKFQKKFDTATHDVDKFRKECDSREGRLKILTTQKSNLELKLQGKQADIVALQMDKASINKEKNELARKASLQENKILELEAKVENLKERISSEQKMVEALQKEHKENEEKINELTRLRNAYMEETKKQQVIIVNLQLDLKGQAENLTTANKNLDAMKLEVTKLQAMLKRVEKARDRIAGEVVELNKIISKLNGEIKGLELQVGESEKTVANLRQQLEEEYAKYKLLGDDERFYRKSCADANRKIEKLSNELTLLNKHILQLKSDNQELDDQRKKLVYQLKNTSDNLDNVKESLKQEKKVCEELSKQIQRKENEEQNLLKNISSLDKVINNLKRKLKNALEDKDTLSTRLNERDALIMSGKERIRLLEQDLSTLDRLLMDRVEDIKLLKLQISEMHRCQTLMEGKVDNLHTTRQDLVEVYRELQDEQLKSKKMEGEIQRPVNFHRWRILEGTDPDRAQLVAKTHALQKQLIQKTGEMDAKMLELREKEQLIQNLREMIRRRSDVAAEEHLMDCKRELNSRMERLKCVTAENNMYENLVGKYRKEVMALREQLRKYKMEEFELKTRPKKKKSV
ncbi:cilia-and flagella-associated protein 58 [Nephila pilipes]|uniref:Cilia-and flagella-associated protein 58 n=1 Tax=Nephila pilipes TaxID=299642 RepID=A0A8X6UJM3_NEPPI|nr:cilia-and flagella-associated protein 58 [Nephila pilipes]